MSLMLASVDEIEADNGPRDGGGATERCCILTRTVKPVDDLIRFVLGPDGSVVPDLKRNLPGRGVWVTADRDSVEAAARKRLFGRGFKADVTMPPDLSGLTERLLERHVLDGLAMAQKAGQVIAGFTKVDNALTHDPVIGVIAASDASADGRRKIVAAVRRRFADAADDFPLVGAFTSAQLDLALGRSNVVHAALLAGSASKGFLSRWRRLKKFMGAERATVSTSEHG